MDWSDAEVAQIGAMRSETIALGAMVATRHTIPAGFDSSPLYAGLPRDMCPCEHWCYLQSGRLRYRFADGDEMEASAGQAFYVRSGHLAEVPEAAVLIEFTPADQYEAKVKHLAARASALEGSAQRPHTTWDR